MESGERLLVKSFDRHGSDLLVAMGLQQCGRVGPIGLITQDVAARVMRRQEQDSMAQTLDLPGPVVGGAARLQEHGSGRALREKAGQLAARKSPALADAAGFSRDGYLENVLGQVDGDGRMLLHGLLLSVAMPKLRTTLAP
jgi:hypothetical protein